MKIFILGINGFIGSSLLPALLNHTDHTVVGLDIEQHKIANARTHPRFQFRLGDMNREEAWVKTQIEEADVVLPLVAIANPALYVADPLRVFGLDFEANLPLIRACVTHKKRLIFPSTSEVYGMCQDETFHEETSSFVLGPISKQRWIYSASKQLLDRVIYAHGIRDGLDYTLFRPFNWIGPQQDTLHPEYGGQGRVVVQFLGNILRGLPLQLVDGGTQRRAFTDIEDGVSALLRMIDNPSGQASQKIFNVGNPQNDVSIATFAQLLLDITHKHPLCPPQAHNTTLEITESTTHYGTGYQDVTSRVPHIEAADKALQWKPQVSLDTSLHKIVDYHLTRFYG